MHRYALVFVFRRRYVSPDGEPFGSPPVFVPSLPFVIYFSSSSAIKTEQRIKFGSCVSSVLLFSKWDSFPVNQVFKRFVSLAIVI